MFSVVVFAHRQPARGADAQATGNAVIVSCELSLNASKTARF